MMKKKILFASMIAFAGIFVSCNNEPDGPVDEKAELPDSILVYNISSDGTETLSQIIYYTYDEVGNLIGEIGYVNWSIDGILPNHKKEMKYDDNGNLIEQRDVTYLAIEEVWSYSTCWRWTYDSKNRISTIEVYKDYGETIDEYPFAKGIYSWSDETHAECLTYEILREEASRLTSKADLTYNAHGDIENQIVYWYMNESWQLGQIDEYTYDSHNNVLSYIYTSNGKIVLQKYYKYDYNDNESILVKWCNVKRGDADEDEYTEKSVYYY